MNLYFTTMFWSRTNKNEMKKISRRLRKPTIMINIVLTIDNVYGEILQYRYIRRDVLNKLCS